MCSECHRRKVSFRSAGKGGRKRKAAEARDAKALEESSVSDEESDGSGKRWMLRFSTMKVGPPKGVKVAKRWANTRGKILGTGEKVGSQGRLVWTAGLEAKEARMVL